MPYNTVVNQRSNQMKYRVIFIAGSRRQTEEVIANNPFEAQQVVLARNPNAKIVNVTGT
jgi:hypothetical protein